MMKKETAIAFTKGAVTVVGGITLSALGMYSMLQSHGEILSFMLNRPENFAADAKFTIGFGLLALGIMGIVFPSVKGIEHAYEKSQDRRQRKLRRMYPPRNQ